MTEYSDTQLAKLKRDWERDRDQSDLVKRLDAAVIDVRGDIAEVRGLIQSHIDHNGHIPANQQDIFHYMLEREKRNEVLWGFFKSWKALAITIGGAVLMVTSIIYNIVRLHTGG